MDRDHFYAIMNGEGTLDYELYLNTKQLLSCQKNFQNFCNRDELQFQIVHQIEELWMKLIGYTLLDIDDYLQQENTNRVITLFRRVHMAERLLTDQLALLETMSPKEYQEIRAQLGNGRNLRVFGHCSKCISRCGNRSKHTIWTNTISP
jgi:tryptophan 2,3-dioxygenase